MTRALFSALTAAAWLTYFRYGGLSIIPAVAFTLAALFVIAANLICVRRFIRRHAVERERNSNPWLWSKCTNTEIEEKIFGDVL